MRVSVAIATYNGEKFIIEQLESIKNQNIPVDEVVICDDESTDSTVNLCRLFIENNNLLNWKIIENNKNLGYCLNFYRAIEICTGDIIFLADQDDIWNPDKTEKMISCLENHKEITVLSSRYNLIDENSNIIKNDKIPYMGEVFDNSIEYLSCDSFIGCSYVRGFSICFRKEIKNLLKPIDLKSLLSHDWYICILGTIIGKTAVLNTKLCSYRYHQNNLSLSDITRKTFLGDREKRITGLIESIEGHKYISSLVKEGSTASVIDQFCDFESKRLLFLKTKNIFIWLVLFFRLKEYSRYYKGKCIRVWLGDFAYAFNINFKKSLSK